MNDREMIKEIDFKDETGSLFVLKYFLDNKDNTQERHFADDTHLFLIAVEKHEKSALTATAEAEDTGWFSASRRDAMNFAELLIKHAVTPMALHYVADDVFC